MKKINIIFFIISILFFSQFFSVEKHVIGSRGVGFFSNFFGVLMHLIGCKKNRLVPVVYWDRRTPYYVDNGNQYNNVWEYYFEPVSNLRHEKGDQIHRNPIFPGVPLIHSTMQSYKNNFAYEFRKNMNNIIYEYIKIKKHILAKIDFFFENYMKGKKIIGIHVRRTDKIAESYLIDLDVFLKVVDEYKGYKIFVASDQQSVIEKFKKTYPDQVIYYDSHRSSDSSHIHLGRDKKDPLNAIIGEEVLIETILFSKCDVFLHSVSNVSTAVLFFNPELKHIFLDPLQCQSTVNCQMKI